VTVGVGKIYDIFAGKSVMFSYSNNGNVANMERTIDIADADFEGVCYVNLVDTDMIYGHRRDIEGYAKAVSAFDSQLEELIGRLREDDLLIITADHGCDPSYTATTDHTRECVPVLVYSRKYPSRDLGKLSTFADIGCTVCDYLGVPFDELDGTSFLSALT
jgi:phosphopentomutase